MSATKVRPKPDFSCKADFMATYEYVKSGRAQVVDVRSVQEFREGSIPKAIDLPYESVLQGDRIQDGAALERTFSALDKKRPVIAYSNTGVKASLVWFALELSGFDAKLYSYEDWLVNEAALANVDNLSKTKSEGDAENEK